jgi:hypothetical protein
MPAIANANHSLYLSRVPKSLPEELERKPGLLNVKDLSEILGLHSETIRDWARQGRLPHVRVAVTPSNLIGTGFRIGSGREKARRRSNVIGSRDSDAGCRLCNIGSNPQFFFFKSVW